MAVVRRVILISSFAFSLFLFLGIFSSVIFQSQLQLPSPQMLLKSVLLCHRNIRNLTHLTDFVTLTRGLFLSKVAAMSNLPEPVDAPKLKYLNQNEAITVDQELFNEYKFSVDQLMELAGLSVATAVAKGYQDKKTEKVLVIAGPGNNGGDGLVAARHLKLFGFQNVTILNARKPTKDLYLNLLHQATQNDVEITYDPKTATLAPTGFGVGLIIDALFGFSFKPPVRPDFQPLMDIMVKSAGSIPIVSVDIPSGWDVEKGPPEQETIRFMPDMLVSLTAPKLCASYFQGRYHFLGGRFVPLKLAEKYAMNLPDYQGTECVVRLK